MIESYTVGGAYHTGSVTRIGTWDCIIASIFTKSQPY